MTEEELDLNSKKLAICFYHLGILNEGNFDYQNALKNYRKAAVMDPDEKKYAQDISRVANRLTIIINE